jgi:hypothetical protein
MLILDNSIHARGRCKVTQQPEEVAYIPKTPASVVPFTTKGEVQQAGYRKVKDCP